MDCQEAKTGLSPYLDGELPPDDAAGITGHLTGCAACRRSFEELRLVSTAIRTQLAICYAPSPDLRAKVLAALDDVPPTRARQRDGRQRWLSASALMLAGLLVGVMSTWFLAVPGKDARLVDEAIAGHLRSQLADSSTDVAASDIGSVATWLGAQSDVAPPVPDMAQAGYTLVGARIEYMYKRKVAAVAYRASGHLVSVFVWRAEERSPFPVKRLYDDGFNLALWSDGERTYCAVSDLGTEELERFTGDYAVRVTPLPNGRSSRSEATRP